MRLTQTEFDVSVERFEYYSDGSFYIITPDGGKTRVTSPESA
jgi:hypothetical protein